MCLSVSSFRLRGCRCVITVTICDNKKQLSDNAINYSSEIRHLQEEQLSRRATVRHSMSFEDFVKLI